MSFNTLANPLPNILSSYSCDAKVTTDHGIIQSQDYPNYKPGVDGCNIVITPAKEFGVKIFVIDLAIDDFDIPDPEYNKNESIEHKHLKIYNKN